MNWWLQFRDIISPHRHEQHRSDLLWCKNVWTDHIGLVKIVIVMVSMLHFLILYYSILSSVVKMPSRIQKMCNVKNLSHTKTNFYSNFPNVSTFWKVSVETSQVINLRHLLTSTLPTTIVYNLLILQFNKGKSEQLECKAHRNVQNLNSCVSKPPTFLLWWLETGAITTNISISQDTQLSQWCTGYKVWFFYSPPCSTHPVS
jgi:hypothetical protein